MTEEYRKELEKRIEKDPASGGKTKYQKYLRGERMQAREAITAKCYECCCGYRDGRIDCEIDACPLYPFMPYRKV